MRVATWDVWRVTRDAIWSLCRHSVAAEGSQKNGILFAKRKVDHAFGGQHRRRQRRWWRPSWAININYYALERCCRNTAAVAGSRVIGWMAMPIPHSTPWQHSPLFRSQFCRPLIHRPFVLYQLRHYQSHFLCCFVSSASLLPKGRHFAQIEQKLLHERCVAVAICRRSLLRRGNSTFCAH